jgi:hypothetical protein
MVALSAFRVFARHYSLFCEGNAQLHVGSPLRRILSAAAAKKGQPPKREAEPKKVTGAQMGLFTSVYDGNATDNDDDPGANDKLYGSGDAHQ